LRLLSIDTLGVLHRLTEAEGNNKIEEISSALTELRQLGPAIDVEYDIENMRIAFWAVHAAGRQLAGAAKSSERFGLQETQQAQGHEQGYRDALIERIVTFEKLIREALKRLETEGY
jgi:hypothetical protein